MVIIFKRYKTITKCVQIPVDIVYTIVLATSTNLDSTNETNNSRYNKKLNGFLPSQINENLFAKALSNVTNF